MSIKQFITKYNGQYIDEDGLYGAQCVDLIKLYFKTVLDIPPVKGNAIDYWNNPPQGFVKIKNTPINYPKQGDLVIFNFGTLGHIAICQYANVFRLRVFEQNNPLGSPCILQSHNYKGVLGWLRFDPQSVVQKPNLPKVPLKIARIGFNLPPASDLIDKIGLYSSNKISCVISDYTLNYSGQMTQELAYQLVDQVNPQEKFVILCYNGTADSVLAATGYDPQRDCEITTSPVNFDGRTLAFEISHQLVQYYNVHRGNNPFIEDTDSMFPSDDFIRAKYDAVSKYYV